MEVKSGYKRSEVGVIPQEWETRTIRDVSDIVTVGFVGSMAHLFTANGVPLLRGQNVLPGRIDLADSKFISPQTHSLWNKSALRGGDVVIVRVGYPGTSAVVPTNLGPANAASLVVVRPDSSFIDSHYMCWVLLSEIGRRQVRAALVGGAQQVINIGTAASILLPVPAKTEQRAIAAALRDVDALLGALDRLIAKKRDLKQAAMQQLLTGQTRLSGFETNTEYKRTDAGIVPGDWEVRPLLSAVRVANGQVDPRIEPYRSMTLVAPDHIESATGRLLARRSAADQKAISGKYLFSSGDIIYSKIRPYLQKAIVADFDGLCSADMYPLRPAAGVSARYMLALLLGHRFSMFAESVSVRSGMPKINRAELAEYSVALPKREEQEAIAEAFTDMDAELTAIEQRRDKTRLVKQGMMQELLTGRTRLV